MASLIEKLKVKTLIEAPFFATLLLRRPLVEDLSCPTAWTDGEQIGYNPNFMERLPFVQALAVVCHEILHIAFLHHLRQGIRESKKWNWACDYCINLILKDNHYELPEGALLDEKFRGMSAEQIYDLLPEDFEKNIQGNGSGQVPCLLGEVLARGFTSAQEKDAYLTELKGQLTEALQTAKLQGNIPLGLDRITELLDRATVSWREVLASFLLERYRSDYSFRRPNKKYIHSGFCLPGIQTIERGRFILAVDTSGSITAKELREFGNEILSILSMSADSLLVLYFDGAVAGTQEIEQEFPDTPLQAVGGGTTDFSPVVSYIMEHELETEVLIYFTDGCCNSFAPEPEYPVLWATKNMEFSPPYGEVIIMS